MIGSLKLDVLLYVSTSIYKEKFIQLTHTHTKFFDRDTEKIERKKLATQTKMLDEPDSINKM